LNKGKRRGRQEEEEGEEGKQWKGRASPPQIFRPRTVSEEMVC